jgi:hypothetical protein
MRDISLLCPYGNGMLAGGPIIVDVVAPRGVFLPDKPPHISVLRPDDDGGRLSGNHQVVAPHGVVLPIPESPIGPNDDAGAAAGGKEKLGEAVVQTHQLPRDPSSEDLSDALGFPLITLRAYFLPPP